MAAVQSVGARVFLMKTPSGIPESNVINIGTQLFAELPFGHWVMPVTGPTVGLAPGMTREQFEAVNQLALQQDDPEGKFRGAFWMQLIAALAAVDVNTDPETLMRLPFRYVYDNDVLELLK